MITSNSIRHYPQMSWHIDPKLWGHRQELGQIVTFVTIQIYIRYLCQSLASKVFADLTVGRLDLCQVGWSSRTM